MTTLLTLERYLQLLWDEAESLARALQTEQFHAPVQACPGWSLADLGYHVGDVVRFWSWVVTTSAVTTDGEPEFARPADAELADWIRNGVSELVRDLTSADPTAPAYSWTPQQDVAFVQRRVPHELSVHRWDAERAVQSHTGAQPRAIATDLATDGIAEFFLLASAFPVEQPPRVDGVALICTDSGAAWTSWLSGSAIQALERDDHVTVEGSGAPDAAASLSGTASDLVLTLWRRLPLGDGRVDVEGDHELARQFLSWANLE